MKTLECRRFSADEEPPWELLLLADPSEEMVRGYLTRSELFGCFSGKACIAVAAVVSQERGMRIEESGGSPAEATAWSRQAAAGLCLRLLRGKFPGDGSRHRKLQHRESAFLPEHGIPPVPYRPRLFSAELSGADRGKRPPLHRSGEVPQGAGAEQNSSR